MEQKKTYESMEERLAFLREKAQEIRYHVVDMVYTAQSGHIGGSLSAAEIMSALYFDVLRIDPQYPRWPERDRFVLSKGHTCPVLYTCLAMRGFFPMETLKTLRQFGSLLQGHPIRKTPGVDVSTGSLGHGFSQAVGIALEAKYMQKDYRIFSLVGNGEAQEGSVWEAAAAASSRKLDNLVVFLDDNRMQNDGFSDEIMPMDPFDKKWEAFGWRVIKIDGHDMRQVVESIEEAVAHRGSPVCILASTIKGKGVKLMENQRRFHGKPPKPEEFTQAMKEIRGEE